MIDLKFEKKFNLFQNIFHLGQIFERVSLIQLNIFFSVSYILRNAIFLGML